MSIDVGKQNADAKTATVSSMNVTAVAESAGLLAEIAGLLAEKNADLPLLLQQKKTQKLAYASSTKNADLLAG